MLADSHAHLEHIFFRPDRERVLDKCISQGITLIINVGTDYNSSIETIKLSEKYDCLYAAVGVHPLCVSSINEEILNRIGEIAVNNCVVAIGEIGLDYKNQDCDKEFQKKWFIEQLLLAKKLDLPVIIHSRGGCDEDIIEILKRVGTPRRGGVIHCFSEDWKLAQEYLSMGLYLSIAGNVTFDDRKHIQNVVRNMDLGKLLVETDSPYVAPNLYKGKRNNPTNIVYTIEKIAEIKGKTFEEISEITYYNTKELFKI